MALDKTCDDVPLHRNHWPLRQCCARAFPPSCLYHAAFRVGRRVRSCPFVPSATIRIVVDAELPHGHLDRDPHRLSRALY